MSGGSELRRWSRPGDMQRAYAFLFDTTSTLQTQMSSDLWRYVYDCESARDRSSAWLQETSYVRRHRLLSERREIEEYEHRLRQLQTNEIQLDAQLLQAAIERQQHAIKELLASIGMKRMLTFPAPEYTVDTVSQAKFQVQSDGVFCAVHALNNIARCVLFSPPDILSAIECTRTLDEQCATPEDVMLMALREGVVLMQLRLTEIDDACALDHPAFQQLLGHTPGIIIFQPSGYGTGHYVPLLYVRGEWVIFSINSVMVRGSTASETLHRYIAQTVCIDAGDNETAREARLRAEAFGAAETMQFIGLMPLPLMCLQATPATESLGSILTRSLLRRLLSEWRLQPSNDGVVEQDLWTPTPLSPCAILEMRWITGFDEAAMTARCDGFEATNLASFIGTRHAVYRELNDLAGQMLGAALDSDFDRSIVCLRQIRSYLVSSPTIDCFFTGAVGADVSIGVAKLPGYEYTLMSNRRWLRLLSLLLVGSALLTEIEMQEDRQLTMATLRVLVLYGLLCCTNMYEYGVRQPYKVAAVHARICKPEHYRNCLPCDSLPEALRDFLFTTPDALRLLTRTVSYDGSLWLLRAAQTLRGFALPRSVVAALELPTLDLENRSEDDQRAVFVSLLRATIFRLPMAGAEFADIDAPTQPLREQSCFETPLLAAHNTESVRAFFNRCTAHQLPIPHEDLVSTIDVLAFDSSYLTVTNRACVVGDNDNRPRLLERAARDGFMHIHRRTFGRIDRRHDARSPVSDNVDRISLPHIANAWHTAEVYGEARALLAAGFFGLLPQHTPEPLQRITDFNIDASDYAIEPAYEFRTDYMRERSKRTRIY